MNSYALWTRTPTRRSRIPRWLALVAVPAVIIGVLFAAPARATVSCWSATLAAPSLACETAVSPATGSATFVLDDVAHTLDYSVTCSGLTATETAAHIHGPAASGTCAAIQVPLDVGCAVSASAATTAAAESAITTGMAYINIHTMMFTAGEIRGDLVAAPCPTPGACADADLSGSVTVTDGVQTLRAAAALPSVCVPSRCDVDGNGTISVTDGVQVLRAAAGLPFSANCPP